MVQKEDSVISLSIDIGRTFKKKTRLLIYSKTKKTNKNADRGIPTAIPSIRNKFLEGTALLPLVSQNVLSSSKTWSLDRCLQDTFDSVSSVRVHRFVMASRRHRRRRLRLCRRHPRRLRGRASAPWWPSAAAAR